MRTIVRKECRFASIRIEQHHGFYSNRDGDVDFYSTSLLSTPRPRAFSMILGVQCSTVDTSDDSGIIRVESSRIIRNRGRIRQSTEFASQQFEFPVGNSRTTKRQRAEQTQCRAEQSCVCWHHAPAAIMHPTHVLC
jgi:hypothetical protein